MYLEVGAALMRLAWKYKWWDAHDVVRIWQVPCLCFPLRLLIVAAFSKTAALQLFFAHLYPLLLPCANTF